MDDLDAGDVDDLLETGGVALKQGQLLAGCCDFKLGLEALADSLGLTGFFENTEGFIAHRKNLLPLFEERSGVFREDLFRLGELGEMNAGFAAFDDGEILPDFVGGEAEDGGDEADERFSDLPEDSLRGAARAGWWARRCTCGP